MNKELVEGPNNYRLQLQANWQHFMMDLSTFSQLQYTKTTKIIGS
jgi:hypothetical protein